MKIISFPENFNKIPHSVVPNALQWIPKNKQPVFISVVGGGAGLYGDGITTFELMIGDRVHGFLSAEQVNKEINKVLALVC